MEQYLWFIPLGVVVGAFGTLIGVGGGFLLMPVLLLLYPGDSPALLTSISLAVVFFNASSGSWAYHRMRRIDYKAGLLFSAAAVPGAILGALTANYIPRRLFNAVFGFLMIAASAYLLLFPRRESESQASDPRRGGPPSPIGAHTAGVPLSYNRTLGVGLSLAVGYLSSLLGLGGGIIHVPALVRLLNFPVHIATATSHLILAITALTGTVVHVASGVFAGGLWRTIALAVGVLPGAQLGARLSSRVSGRWIIRALAVALASVGLRILLTAL